MANSCGDFPGSITLAVNLAGDRYARCSGNISAETSAPPFTPSTIVWLASCTKLVTMIAVLHCVERGLFCLDDNVSDFLPEWEEPVILHGYDDAEEPIMTKSKNKITIRHLVTHTSGLGYETLSEKLSRYTKLKGEANKGGTGNIIHGFDLPLLFEPGEGWRYGCGMDWAGKIVERANPEQLKLGMYMKKYIFEPLGMASMTFSLLSPEDVRSRVATIALRKEGTKVSSLPHIWPENPPDDCGGVGLYGSAEDFMKFLEMLLQKKEGVLRQESIEELFRPLSTPSDYFEQYMSDTNLLATLGIPPHMPCQWSLGGLVSIGSIEGRREASSICWAGLPNVKWWIDFKGGICGLYTSQVFPPSDAISNILYTRFERDAYSKLQNSAA